MSRSLFWLSNDAWAAIEPHLPKNQPGARRVDDRRVISGIVHMLKCGGRWADCPAEYGPATTVYNRWNRWSRRGIWTRILAALTEEGWIAVALPLKAR
jgi:transposase